MRSRASVRKAPQVEVMALSEEDLKDLRNVFDNFDLERKGRISIKSAEHVAIMLGYDPHDKDAPGFDDSFSKVNGVSWQQFENWLCQLQLQPAHPRHRRDFQLLDRTRSKVVSERDLKRFFASGNDGRLRTKRFAKEVVDGFDSKNQGGIDLHDMSKFVKEAKHLQQLRSAQDSRR